MQILNFPETLKRKDLRRLFYWIAVTLAILTFIMAGYFIATNLHTLSQVFMKFPAGILTFLQTDKKTAEEDNDVLDIISEQEEKPEKYVEKAEKGEGLTHLARKALNKDLQENLQNFIVTDEHKVYIEDYIAKKIGGGFLEVGQEIEISADLIEQAINSSAELSPEQLNNLTQYSQFVSF